MKDFLSVAADLRDSGETVSLLPQTISVDVSPVACDAVSETQLSYSALNDDVSEPVTDKSDTDITVAVTSV